MKFEIVAKDGISHLSIEGQLDAVSVSDLRVELDKLVAARPRAVEVDLSPPAHDRQLRRRRAGLALQTRARAGRQRR